MLAFFENCGIIVNALRCGCSSVVEHQPSKLDMWVRFPSPALCASGSVGGARPCQGRDRGFESRLALFLFKQTKFFPSYYNQNTKKKRTLSSID